MKIIEIASKLFLQNLSSSGDNPSSSAVQDALLKLLPNSGSELDIAGLVKQFASSGGLAALASSWLSDGENMSVSSDQVESVLGGSQISEFAGKLGLDSSSALGALTGMIPDLIDKASSGGSLNSDLAGSLVSGLKGKFF